MSPRVLAVLALVGSLGCRRAAEPVDPPASEPPERTPSSQPAIFAEFPPAGHLVTPATLCEHVIAVMFAEGGEGFELPADELAKFRGDCVDELTHDREQRGDARFQTIAACAMKAQSLSAMELCDPPEPTKAEHEALCKHVLEILQREEGIVEPLGGEILRNCVEALGRESETMGPQEYARQRDCVFAATSRAQLEACENP